MKLQIETPKTSEDKTQFDSYGQVGSDRHKAAKQQKEALSLKLTNMNPGFFCIDDT